MYTENTGKPDYDVAKRIAQITSENTPFMQQARTQGLQQANQRGLSNSSIAVGASQAEAYRVAAPIASQEVEFNVRRDEQERSIADSARQQQINALATLSGQRDNAIAAALQNPDLPAAERAAVIRSFQDRYDQNVAYLQNLYGPGFRQAPPPAPVPSGPPIAGGGIPPINYPGGYTPPTTPPYSGPPIAPGGVRSEYSQPGGGFSNGVRNIALQGLSLR